MVHDAEGLARVGAAQLSFCHNKLAGEKFRLNDDDTGVTSSRPKVQSTRAALAFVNMLPSLQSLRRLVDYGLTIHTLNHTAEEIVALLGGSLRDSRPLVRQALATLSWMGMCVWALLYSVFKVSASPQLTDLVPIPCLTCHPRSTTTARPPSRSSTSAGSSATSACR